MARQTPALIRAASILNLIASRPGTSFTFSDILKASKINRGSLHTMLTTLVDIGYLHRSNEKTYALGPELIRIGHAARDTISPLQIAGSEMRALADRYDAVCSAIFKTSDEAIVRERAASSSHIEWGRSSSRRFAMDPPLGLALMAWLGPAEVKRWLDKIGPPGHPERERYVGAMRFPAEHGYACGVRKHEPGPHHDLEQSLMRLEDTEFVIYHLETERQYAMTFLAAPIFDRRGQLLFSLVLSGFGTRSGAAVETLGQDLRASCDRITLAAGGVIPDVNV